MSVDAVNAQTSTPTPVPFSTVAPGATPPASGGAVNEVVRFSFLGGQGTFAVTIGTWQGGLGFKNTPSVGLSVLGGYFLEDISRVTLFYRSTVAFTTDFAICEGSCPPYEFEGSGGGSSCATECSINFAPAGVSGDTFLVVVDAGAGDFYLRAMEVEFAGESESYDVGEDGCPILSPEQLAALDPLYFAQCSECFVTPTPVRDMPIASVALASPTLNLTVSSTFQIPIIVSGTAVTATPATPGLPGGGLFTSTPSPYPTSTPGGDGCIAYEGGTLQSGWSAVPFGFGFTEVGSWNGTAWDSAYAPGADGDLLRIHRSWDGSLITQISITIDGNCTTDTSTFHTTAGYIFSGDTIVDSVGSSSCPYNITNETAVFDLNQTGVTSIDLVSSVFTENDTGWARIKRVEICGDVSTTSTPAPTASPAGTLAPWMNTPVFEDVDCSVAVFGEFEPVADFDPEFGIVAYNCYTIVPEIDIDIPNNDGLHVDGVQWCITWFEFPVITLLGIAVSLDWLLVVVVAFLVRLLMAF